MSLWLLCHLLSTGIICVYHRTWLPDFKLSLATDWWSFFYFLLSIHRKKYRLLFQQKFVLDLMFFASWTPQLTSSLYFHCKLNTLFMIPILKTFNKFLTSFRTVSSELLNFSFLKNIQYFIFVLIHEVSEILYFTRSLFQFHFHCCDKESW